MIDPAVAASWATSPSFYHAPSPPQVTPKPYQLAGVEYIISRNHGLLGDEMGLGKSAQAIMVSNAIEAKRTLIVCPASLRLNLEREVWMWSTIENVLTYPILKAKDGVSTEAHYVIISYDLLRNKGILAALMDMRWDHLILDECFPAGTQVDTECGPMDIAEIVNKKLAVRVWSWCQGVLELKPVRRYVKSNSHSLLEVRTRLGYSIVCTPNHKIWTDNRGYVEAGNLREGDEVRVRPRQNKGLEESEPRKGSGTERQKQIAVQDSCECSCAAESSRESGRGQTHRQGGGLRNVRVECREDEPVLREKMFRHLAVESLPRGRKRESEGYAFCATGHGGSGQEISFRENEASQFRSGVSRQSGRNIEVAERPVVAGETRGEWISHETTDSTTFLSGVAPGEFGVHNKYCGRSGGMPTQLLQSRLGAPTIEDRRRGGRQQSQNEEMEIFGREKNGGTVVDRVERVKTYERGNISQRRDVSGKSTPTYNLEIEDNHNYFANGILVSNCHALKDPKGNQRTKVICAPDLLPSVVGRITMASGTIMSNTPSDAYNAIRLLDWSAIDRASLQDFRETYYDLGGGMVRSPVYDPKIGAMVNKLHWSEEVRNVPTNLADLQYRMRKNLMVRRLKQDVLKDLPTAQWRPFPLVMTSGIKTALAHPGWKMAEKLYEMDALDTSVPVDGEIATARRLLGEAKAPSVAEYIEEMLREGATKLLVAAWHTSVLDILKKRLSKHGLVYMDGATSAGARQRAVDAFQQNPDVKIILGQMQVIGTGWTLTVAQDCVLAEPDWVPGINDQMLARIHRIGQEGAYVTGHVPVVPGTLDERILGAAINKGKNIFAALDKRG